MFSFKCHFVLIFMTFLIHNYANAKKNDGSSSSSSSEGESEIPKTFNKFSRDVSHSYQTGLRLSKDQLKHYNLPSDYYKRIAQPSSSKKSSKHVLKIRDDNGESCYEKLCRDGYGDPIGYNNYLNAFEREKTNENDNISNITRQYINELFASVTNGVFRSPTEFCNNTLPFPENQELNKQSLEESIMPNNFSSGDDYNENSKDDKKGKEVASSSSNPVKDDDLKTIQLSGVEQNDRINYSQTYINFYQNHVQTLCDRLNQYSIRLYHIETCIENFEDIPVAMKDRVESLNIGVGNELFIYQRELTNVLEAKQNLENISSVLYNLGVTLNNIDQRITNFGKNPVERSNFLNGLRKDVLYVENSVDDLNIRIIEISNSLNIFENDITNIDYDICVLEAELENIMNGL